MRSIYADWERGDLGRVDWADPEIEFVVAEGPEPGVSRGLAAMGDQVRGALIDMPGWRGEAEGCRELIDGRVLVLARIAGRGRSTGLERPRLESSRSARLGYARG